VSWFAHPLGLLALAAVPAVVALHLFRRRFAERPVSALFLWQAVDHASISGRRLEPLHRNPSFWLELLAAALLGLACAAPRLPWTQPARHLVVVVDGSLSMAAGAPDSARTRAVAKIRERIASLPRRSCVTLIESGATPRLLAGPAAFPAEAGARLDEWQPSLGRHDLGRALALATELSAGRAVWLVTDRFEPDRHPQDVELLAVGRPLENVGFTHASRTREAGGEKLFLTITSFARGHQRRRLTISTDATADRAPLDARDVELDPDQRLQVEFALPAGTPAIAARLDPDALAADDVVWLAPTPPRTVRLATTLPPAEALALGLTTKRESAVDRWCALVPDSAAAASAADAHVVVGAAPGGGAAAWNLVVTGPAAPPAEARDLIGPFLVEKRHPLLRGVTLDGIVWSVASRHAWSGAPLVSAGDLPLLTEETREGSRLFTLHLDPARSSLQRSPDWPILLSNLAEMRRAELPGPERVNLRTGEELVVRGAGEATFRLEQLAGGAAPAREVVSHGLLVVDGLDAPGLYRLERLGGEPLPFAVNELDAAESDLRELSSGSRPSALDLAEVESTFTAADFGLLTIALALLLANWIYLARSA
jgi:aerotolerance regulator-like protein/VWA domain-containing protein